MYEEDGFSPLDADSDTLRQPPNFIGEFRSSDAFIRSVYQLRVPLSFSFVGVNYPLESFDAFPYGLHCMVGMCA